MAVTETEIDGRIMALTQQREEAQNRIVVMTGTMAKVVKERDELKKQVEELSKPVEPDSDPTE